MIHGTKVQLRDREFVIPPLSIRLRIQHDPKITQIRDNPIEIGATLSAMTDIITIAIQQNYPKVTRENLLDLLDLGTLAEAYIAAMSKPSPQTQRLALSIVSPDA